MYKALLLPLFTGLLSVANAGRINIPRELSLVHYERRIPSTLMERAADNGVFARQDATCTADQTTCDDGTCCAGACCGAGCCPTGYTCDESGAAPACCPAGQTCNGQVAGCTDPTLVPCDGQDFCCPAGETCSLDDAGNAQCGGTAAPPNSGEQTDTATGAGTATTTRRVTTPPAAGATTPAAGATTPVAGGGATTPHATTTPHTSSSSSRTGTSTASSTTSTNAASFNVESGFGKAGVALAGLVLALMA